MQKPDPTPDEITELCEAIRAGWSEAERVRRIRVDWRGAEPVTPVVAGGEIEAEPDG